MTDLEYKKKYKITLKTLTYKNIRFAATMTIKNYLVCIFLSCIKVRKSVVNAS
jgi:hypothetical protein